MRCQVLKKKKHHPKTAGPNLRKPGKGVEIIERLQTADGPVTIVVQRPGRRTLTVRKSGFRSSRVTRLIAFFDSQSTFPQPKYPSK